MAPGPQSGGSFGKSGASMKDTVTTVRETLLEKGSEQNTSIWNPCNRFKNSRVQELLCILQRGDDVSTTTVKLRPARPRPWPVTTERHETGTLIAAHSRRRHNHTAIIWTSVVVTLAVILALAACGFYYYRKSRRLKRRRPSKTPSSNLALDNLKTENNTGGNGSVIAPLLPHKKSISKTNGVSGSMMLVPSYEIPESHFIIDWKTILGKGNFGIVYKGSVRDETVAVKTLLPDVLDPKSIRSMLAEMKVMSELGTHPHVVRLVGVNTAHVDQGNVYIFTEICPMGGLQAFLRKHKDKFIANEEEEVPSGDSSVLTLDDLYRYSYQVCSGMTYLADKKIVHGDLATRNILLLNKEHVKIADFGLALKMYNYTGYVRRQEQEQLPWKWMAIETLKYEKFSSESDVWSFGILLWEIFTLGEIPYPGRRNCTDEFVQQFEQGIRAKQPTHATREMYEIMLKCWHVEPESRPNFNEIRKLIYPFLGKEYLDLDPLAEVPEDEEGYLMPNSTDFPPESPRYV